MSIIKESDGTLRNSDSVVFGPSKNSILKCPKCGVVYDSFLDVVSLLDKNDLLCNECGTPLEIINSDQK